MAKKLYNSLWFQFWKIWNKIGPPWRPSVKEIKWWEKKIVELNKSNKNLKALVLGSTPEIRDMLAKNKIDTTLLDANQSMYEAMNKLIKKKNNREKLVVGNWLEMEKVLGENRFDFVIGDAPHCNLAYKTWPRFFDGLYNVLKPGGYFMVGSITLEFNERQTIEDLFNKYKRKKKYFKNFKNRLWELYQLADEKGVWTNEVRGFSYEAVRKLLKREGAKRKIGLKELDENLWFLSGDINGEALGNYVEVMPTLEEQINLQSKWFYLDELYLILDHSAFKIRRAMILKSKRLK
ncbi:MAG: class I SAM-dependent methyltransferase [Candidatus Moranbacteria bacterium]|nr:class I SAM-dependent methyltransferase [Candidatus Moranbacteria bacterium]